MEKSVLIDLTRCIGCRACQVACKQWNERTTRKTFLDGNFTNPKKMTSDCYTHIRFIEDQRDGGPVWSYIKDQCLHCAEPACVSVCPVTALKKTETGPVVYDYDRCIGCRYCMMACPFHIPKYEWEKVLPWVQKCSFCSERIKDGLEPACIKVCPTETMFYGDRKTVLMEAEQRIKNNPAKYVQHIYGKREAGGTTWMYISDVPFDKLGFKMDVPEYPLATLTWDYIAKIPALFGIVFVAGVGGWVITRRNANMGKEE